VSPADVSDQPRFVGVNSCESAKGFAGIRATLPDSASMTGDSEVSANNSKWAEFFNSIARLGNEHLWPIAPAHQFPKALFRFTALEDIVRRNAPVTTIVYRYTEDRLYA
jgi:hypothetical protein